MNDDLPEETSQPVLDETTNNVNLEGRCLQTRNESDNRSVAKPPDTETLLSISLVQIKLDKTETYETFYLH